MLGDVGLGVVGVGWGMAKACSTRLLLPIGHWIQYGRHLVTMVGIALAVVVKGFSIAVNGLGVLVNALDMVANSLGFEYTWRDMLRIWCIEISFALVMLGNGCSWHSYGHRTDTV